MDGVVNDVPVPSETPPVEAAYQLIVPADALAPRDTVPGPQRVAGVVPVIVGIALTEITALPVIGVVPPKLVPLTVYVPKSWFPKEIATPVPTTVGTWGTPPFDNV